MTAAQALHLTNLHQKEARPERDRQTFRIAEAERRARGEPRIFGPEDTAPLPDLSQVTGWPKADPAKADVWTTQFGG